MRTPEEYIEAMDEVITELRKNEMDRWELVQRLFAIMEEGRVD